METKIPTPRHTRHRLNRMEGWFNRNRTRFTIQRQETADELFLHAETALHADALGEALKAWLAEGDYIARRITEPAVEPTAARNQKPLASGASIKA